MDDKYIPWFIIPIIIGFGVLGYLLYISIMKNTPLPLPLRTMQPNSSLQTLQAIDSNIFNQIPEGKLDTRNVNATGSIYELYDVVSDGLNWISAQVCNNGPNNVYYSVNNWENPEAPIIPGQCISVNLMRKASIKKIYFKCNTGETASVSIYGVK